MEISELGLIYFPALSQTWAFRPHYFAGRMAINPPLCIYKCHLPLTRPSSPSLNARAENPSLLLKGNPSLKGVKIYIWPGYLGLSCFLCPSHVGQLNPWGPRTDRWRPWVKMEDLEGYLRDMGDNMVSRWCKGSAFLMPMGILTQWQSVSCILFRMELQTGSNVAACSIFAHVNPAAVFCTPPLHLLGDCKCMIQVSILLGTNSTRDHMGSLD